MIRFATTVLPTAGKPWLPRMSDVLSAADMNSYAAFGP